MACILSLGCLEMGTILSRFSSTNRRTNIWNKRNTNIIITHHAIRCNSQVHSIKLQYIDTFDTLTLYGQTIILSKCSCKNFVEYNILSIPMLQQSNSQQKDINTEVRFQHQAREVSKRGPTGAGDAVVMLQYFRWRVVN